MTAETNAAAFKQGLYEIYRKHELATAELVFSDLERIAADIAALLRAGAAKVPEDELRARFEARMNDGGRWNNATMRAPNGGGYLLMQVALAWEEWKACAEALATPPAPDAGVVEPAK